MAKLAKPLNVAFTNPAATVAGLFIALVVFNAFSYVWARLHPASQQDPKDVAAAFVPMVITWTITFLLFAVVVFWERQGLASLGLGRPKLADVAWGLAGFAVGGLLFLLTKRLIEMLGLVDVQVRAEKLNAFPLWIAIPGILTNGFGRDHLPRIRY